MGSYFAQLAKRYAQDAPSLTALQEPEPVPTTRAGMPTPQPSRTMRVLGLPSIPEVGRIIEAGKQARQRGEPVFGRETVTENPQYYGALGQVGRVAGALQGGAFGAVYGALEEDESIMGGLWKGLTGKRIVRFRYFLDELEEALEMKIPEKFAIGLGWAGDWFADPLWLINGPLALTTKGRAAKVLGTAYKKWGDDILAAAGRAGMQLDDVSRIMKRPAEAVEFLAKYNTKTVDWDHERILRAMQKLGVSSIDDIPAVMMKPTWAEQATQGYRSLISVGHPFGAYGNYIPGVPAEISAAAFGAVGGTFGKVLSKPRAARALYKMFGIQQDPNARLLLERMRNDVGKHGYEFAPQLHEVKRLAHAIGAENEPALIRILEMPMNTPKQMLAREDAIMRLPKAIRGEAERAISLIDNFEGRFPKYAREHGVELSEWGERFEKQLGRAKKKHAAQLDAIDADWERQYQYDLGSIEKRQRAKAGKAADRISKSKDARKVQQIDDELATIQRRKEKMIARYAREDVLPPEQAIVRISKEIRDDRNWGMQQALDAADEIKSMAPNGIRVPKGMSQNDYLLPGKFKGMQRSANNTKAAALDDIANELYDMGRISENSMDAVLNYLDSIDVTPYSYKAGPIREAAIQRIRDLSAGGDTSWIDDYLDVIVLPGGRRARPVKTVEYLKGRRQIHAARVDKRGWSAAEKLIQEGVERRAVAQTKNLAGRQKAKAALRKSTTPVGADKHLYGGISPAEIPEKERQLRELIGYFPHRQSRRDMGMIEKLTGHRPFETPTEGALELRGLIPTHALGKKFGHALERAMDPSTTVDMANDILTKWALNEAGPEVRKKAQRMMKWRRLFHKTDPDKLHFFSTDISGVFDGYTAEFSRYVAYEDFINQIAAKHGRLADEMTEELAAGTWMLSSNKRLQKYAFPAEIAVMVDEHVDALTNLPLLRKMVDGYDELLSTMRAVALTWPSYHVRNVLGGNFMHGFVHGKCRNMRYYRDGFAISAKHHRLAHSLKNLDDAFPGLDKLRYKTAMYGEIDGNEMMRLLEGGGIFSQGLFGYAVTEGRRRQLRGPLQWNRQLGEYIENGSRVALAIDAIERQGMTVEQAGRHVAKYLFNYGELGQWEKTLGRRLMFFYAWPRNNFLLHARRILEEPAWDMKVARMLNHAQRTPLAAPQEVVPKWMKQQIGVPVARDEKHPGNYKYWMMSNWIPSAEIWRLAEIMRTEEGFFDALTKISGSYASPLLRAPLEQMFNKNLYFGRAIEEFPGESVSFMGLPVRKRLAHFLQQIRFMNEIDRLNPFYVFGRQRLGRTEFTSPGQKWGATLLGRVYPFEEQKQRMRNYFEFKEKEKLIRRGLRRAVNKGDTGARRKYLSLLSDHYQKVTF
jgi:DNA-directed RNA polymerase subunit F